MEGWTTRDATSPLYGRSKRDSPLDVRHGAPDQGAGPPQAARSAGGKKALLIGWPLLDETKYYVDVF